MNGLALFMTRSGLHCGHCGHLAELHTDAGTCTRWVTQPGGAIVQCPCTATSNREVQEVLW